MNAEQKYEQCLRITNEAIEKMEVKEKCCLSQSYLEKTKNYVHDAKYYAKNGDYVTALEAIAYAHGFIDAGVLAGFFNIKGYHLKQISD